MGGLGFLIGGALEGFGKGLATQGMQEYEERKKVALENLRARNDRANTDYEHVLKTELEGTKHQNALEQATHQYELMDGNAARQNDRTTNSSIVKATTESNLQEGREKRVAEFRSNLAMREAAQKAGLDSKDVTDVVTDGVTGAVSIVTKGGESRILPNIIARPKPGAASGDGANDWRSALGGDGGAPSTSSKPPAAPQKATPLKGASQFSNDAAIEAFMSNKANRGKPFVDSRNGKTYWVPY